MISNKCTKHYDLNNGKVIPALALGTWRSTEKEAYDAVTAALKAGYRHIDTAAIYGNEEIIGKAIKDSEIPREELFVTTKLWCTGHKNPSKALDISLEKLGLDYVDLYLMHWPVPLNPEGNDPNFPTLANGKRDILNDWDFVKTYILMQGLVSSGKAKAIGVSNFTVKRLKELLASKDLKYQPAANQVELHPYLPQFELVKFCKEHNIIVEAYSPLGSAGSPLLQDKVINELAEKYKVSAATILISWAVWRDTVVLPKSVSAERIDSNMYIVDLSDEDGEKIDNISKVRGTTRLILPDWSPFVVFDDDF